MCTACLQILKIEKEAILDLVQVARWHNKPTVGLFRTGSGAAYIIMGDRTG